MAECLTIKLCGRQPPNLETKTMTDETPNTEQSRVAADCPNERLVRCDFLGTSDPDFRAFVESMPDEHWAKYDLSAVRLGWEAYKALHT